jgi:hypothetical protein
MEKATQFSVSLGIEGFSASQGWLESWKKRNNVSFMKMQGEKGSADFAGAEQWIKTVLPQLTVEFADVDTYNADETALFFKALPTGTFATKGSQPCSDKISKERITVLFLCNKSGSDKQAIVVGKFKSPRCFKSTKQLPLPYYSNSKAWMTSTIWTTILKEFDKKLQKEKRKIILFCDNAACHKVPNDVKFQNITVTFMPPNTTSIIQPLDQGIIRCFKVYYRHAISRCQISFLERGESKDAFVKHVDILRAMRMLKHAWWLVTPETIHNCFRKAGFVCQDAPAAALDETLVQVDAAAAEINAILAEFSTVNDRQHILSLIEEEEKEGCYGEMTDAELIAEAVGQCATDEAEPSELVDVQSIPVPLITVQEVMTSLSIVRTFLEENNIDGTDECFHHYFNLERYIVKKSTVKLRQITLDRFINSQ